jgi:hypothetical protein
LPVKKLVQSNIKGLVANNLTERKTCNDLFEPKSVQTGDSDLLTKQLVKNQFVSPNSTQTNDISITLITCVKFLRQECPKSCVILQKPPLSTLQL